MTGEVERTAAGRLGDALEAIEGCPPEMTTMARFGYYDPDLSPAVTPLVQLAADLGVLARSPGITPGARAALAGLLRRVACGEFGATAADSAAWLTSPGVQAAVSDLLGGSPP